MQQRQSKLYSHPASVIRPVPGEARRNGEDRRAGSWATTTAALDGREVGASVVVHVEPVGPTAELLRVARTEHVAVRRGRRDAPACDCRTAVFELSSR